MPPDTRADLRNIGELRARHERASQAAWKETYRLILVGHSEGISVSEIARLARVSRWTAHKALREEK